MIFVLACLHYDDVVERLAMHMTLVELAEQYPSYYGYFKLILTEPVGGQYDNFITLVIFASLFLET